VDQFRSLQESIRLVRATVGDSTDELQSSQQTDQIMALFDAAASKVQGLCRWLSTQRRASIGIDPGQEVLSYAAIEQAYWLEQHYPSQYLPLTYGTAADTFNPADLATADIKYIGPANIIEMAISGADTTSDGSQSRNTRQYVRLPKVIITVENDLDREVKLPQEAGKITAFNGGTAAEVNAAVTAESDLSTANRGCPTYAECRSDGIHFNVINDARRVIRINYAIVASWGYHAQVLTTTQILQLVSVVDSVAIEHQVISDMFAQQGDQLQSLRYCNDEGRTPAGAKGTGKFWERIRSLRGYQNTGQRIALDDSCTFDQDRDLPDICLPNWANYPRLTSNAQFLGSN
jgi:hypothetical protein